MKLTDILKEIYLRPITIQSDFAREYDQTIAALASTGYITTRELPSYTFGRTWRLTEKGMKELYETS